MLAWSFLALLVDKFTCLQVEKGEERLFDQTSKTLAWGPQALLLKRRKDSRGVKRQNGKESLLY